MNRLTGNRAMPDQGRLLQVSCPQAAMARPGHWFRLSLPGLTLALPVLDRSSAEQWLAFQVPPDAAAAVSALAYGTPCDLDGPHGPPLTAPPQGRRLLLLADDRGLAVALFAARLAAAGGAALALALVEISGAAPVRLRPSRFLLPGMPPGTIAGLGPLEDAGIASRVAHPHGDLPGCHEGGLASLLLPWLEARTAEQRWGDAVAVAGAASFTHHYGAMLRGRVGQYQLLGLPALGD